LCRTGDGGTKVQERTVRQLSGGERRRVALGLALGFAELATARARLRCNLLVLDEVSTIVSTGVNSVLLVSLHTC